MAWPSERYIYRIQGFKFHRSSTNESEMKQAWEQFIWVMAQHLKSGDLVKELRTRVRITLSPPEYPQYLEDAFYAKEEEVTKMNKSMREMCESVLAEQLLLNPNMTATERLPYMKDIAHYKALELANKEFKLSGKAKEEYNLAKANYQNRLWRLVENRRSAFAILRGQCTHNLIQKMSSDPQWDAIEAEMDPLSLYELIEKTVRATWYYDQD